MSRARRKHATPPDDKARLMCRVDRGQLEVDDAAPDCRRCLRAIARYVAEHAE